jgi:hypothetical protein
MVYLKFGGAVPIIVIISSESETSMAPPNSTAVRDLFIQDGDFTEKNLGI